MGRGRARARGRDQPFGMPLVSDHGRFVSPKLGDDVREDKVPPKDAVVPLF